MPELPEVETVCRGMARVLEGRRITRVDVRRPDLRRPFPPDLAERLTGAQVTRIDRRAKYALLHTDRGDAAILHLGMSGRIRLDPESPEKHDHVVFETEDGHTLAFNDARRFGSLDITREDALAEHPLMAHLGPEPLGNEFNAGHLARKLAGKIMPIKLALLDQRIVAGLGNIYVCEALFGAGINPACPSGGLAVDQLERLVAEIRAVLVRAIEAGGSSLRDYAQVNGELGYFQHEWRVYGRESEPCRQCSGPIARIVQGGRSTFYCGNCQR